MRSNYFIGICVVIASLIIGAKDIHALIQSKNVIGTTNGLVRLGQVNSETTLVKFAVNMSDGSAFEAEGPVSEIVGIAKNKMMEIVNQKNKLRSKTDKEYTLDTILFVDKSQMNLSSKLIYSSEYQPLFTLNLHSANKELPEKTNFISLIPDLEKFIAEVKVESKSYSFM